MLFRGKITKIALAIGTITAFKAIFLFAFPSIFVKKVSERKSLDLDAWGVGFEALDTFMAFSLLSLPFVAIGIKGAQALSLVNIASSYFTYRQLARLETSRTNKGSARLALGLLVLAPGVFYFSMVALRDFFTAVLLLVFMVRIADGQVAARWVTSGFLVVLLGSLRPELLVYLSAVTFIWIFLTSETSLAVKLVSFAVGPFVLFLILQSVLAASFHLDVSDLGLIKDVLIEPRFERQFRADGGNSAIMEASRFHQIGLGHTLFVQFFSTICIPGLPRASWTSLDWLAFMDSAVFIVAIFFIVYLALVRKRREALFGALSVLIYLIFITPFMVNYGNAFRIRLPAEIICYTFIYLSYIRWYTPSRSP